MSFFGSIRYEQQAVRTARAGHPVNNHLNPPDFFRLRQMERTLLYANMEIGRLKARISRLEGLPDCRFEPVRTVNENAKLPGRMTNMLSLSIAELEELAAMAKRFK